MKYAHSHIKYLILSALVLLMSQAGAQNEAKTLLFGRTPTLATVQDSMNFDQWQLWEHLDSNYFGTMVADAIWKDCEQNRAFYAHGRTVYSHQLGAQSALPIDSTVDTGTLSNTNLMQAYLFPHPGDRQKLIYLNLHTNPFWTVSGFPHNVRVGIYDKGLGPNGLIQAFDLDTQKVVGIGVARHENMRDYWILLAHRQNATTAVLRVYAVTAAGVNPIPVSTRSFYHESVQMIYGLHLAVSPRNNRIIISAQENYLSILDFDHSTGQISGVFGFNFYVRFPAGPGLFSLVGGTFSGGGERYYVYYFDARRTNVRRFIVQFNALASDSVQFYQSLGGFNAGMYFPESFHLGRDQRLYISGRDNALAGRLKIACFHAPDSFGLDARLQWDYRMLFIPRVDTPSERYYFSYVLPDFNRKDRFTIKGRDSVCVGDEATYVLSEPHRLDSLRWYYNDPLTGQTLGSTLLEFRINFTQRATITLNCVAYYCDSVMILQKEIVVDDIPENLLHDTSFCNQAEIWVQAPNDGSRIRQWSTGSSAAQLRITAPGWYWLERESRCGFNRDSFYVSSVLVPEHGLPADTFICVGNSILLTANAGDYQILWPDGDQSFQKSLFSAGTYVLRLEDSCGLYYDTLRVYSLDVPLSGAIDTLTCNRRPFSFPDSSWLFTSAIWSDGSTAYPRQFTEPFDGNVRIINPCGEGNYDLQVAWVDCDCKIYAPTAFTPNGDGLNEHFRIFTACDLNSFQMRIFDRWGRELYYSDRLEKGWDGTYNGEPLPDGHYTYTVIYTTSSQGAPQLKDGITYMYR